MNLTNSIETSIISPMNTINETTTQDINSKLDIISKLKSVVDTVKNESPSMYWIVMLNLLFAILAGGAMLFDDRMLTGVNVWLKPLKFLLSTAIYIFTVGFFTSLMPYTKRKKAVLNNTVAWTLLLEVGIIVYQGARGVQSHYNVSNPVDGILFGLMGIFIGINVLIMILFVIDSIRLKMKTSRPVQWAFVIGWIVIIVGSWVGGQMISQMSHTVGIADGGQGIPLLKWSSIAGDLRIAHFFGIHGLQILPLFAWIITKKWKTSTTNMILATVGFGLIYAGWIAFTYLQAKAGIALLNI